MEFNDLNAEEHIQFDRTKIYEKLEYIEKPKGYSSSLPWNVQMQIAATNGKQYADLVGHLESYPQYELPVSKTNEGIMLDIGCGWGRWLVAGAGKGYLPIGLDLRLEFCQASLRTLQDHKIHGYVVAADLMALPFQNGIFDLIWSFSVIQHTHKVRMEGCLNEIKRIFNRKGFTKLEFPNRDGFRNKKGPVQQSALKENEFNSWVVRYYSVEEYKKIFNDIFENFRYDIHSFLGIGVLKEDLKYVSLKNKILCGTSLALTNVSRLFPFLKRFGDSLYIEAENKSGVDNTTAIANFRNAHSLNPENNLNVIQLLQCPISKEPLKIIDGNSDFVLNESMKIKYPIVNGVPLVIKSEATII